MKHTLLYAVVLFSLPALAAKPAPVPTYMNIEEAVAAHPNFLIIGEYVSKNRKTAIQANMLSDSTFLVAQYKNGLPDEGWNKSAIISSVKTAEELNAALNGFQKVERESPTFGKPQPKDAILKFPNGFTNIKDGIMMAGGKTKGNLGSFHMHLEFIQPLKPGRNPSNQDRGNNGIYIFNNYERQIINTFRLDYENPENNAIKLDSIKKQWCGSLYKQKLPDVNMTYPPLRWQTYDIDFMAPEIDGGKKVKNARITVRHNGILIHNDHELKSETDSGAKHPQLAKGPILFQNHVMFRNF